MTSLVIDIVCGIVLISSIHIGFGMIGKHNMETVLRQDESEKVERYRKLLEDKQKQIEFYISRCRALEKKAELLEEEITKLRIKK